MVIPPTCYRTRKPRRLLIQRVIDAGAKKAYSKKARRARAIFRNAKRKCESAEQAHIPTPEKGVRSDTFKEVMSGAKASDFPPIKEVQDKVKVPVLVCAWDCDDQSHPMSTVTLLSKLIPHARLSVAKEPAEVRTTWAPTIAAFVKAINRKQHPCK
mmetsp:Transcript_4606/g.9234  ORF Transcript_4606/g.9234 Transcript_4606/m.9234 type:complete len:156 (-) Transcript_4606:177-644(-)